jgi:hypothetical protein
MGVSSTDPRPPKGTLKLALYWKQLAAAAEAKAKQIQLEAA